MAVIDHDDFSNVSWHSDHNDMMAGFAASTSSIPVPEAEPPSIEEQRHGEELVQEDPGLSGDILECTVSEPRKESDGTKDAFVSYLITTNVSKDKRSPAYVRRHLRTRNRVAAKAN